MHKMVVRVGSLLGLFTLGLLAAVPTFAHDAQAQRSIAAEPSIWMPRTSEPGPFVTVGSMVLFGASNPRTGRELWRTDGTTTGTYQVLDLARGPDSGVGYDYAAVGSTLFFAGDGGNGLELWRTDGTARGTRQVKDINPTKTMARGAYLAESSNPTLLTDVVGTLFFVADDSVSGNELWRSDGTAQGTIQVVDLAPEGADPEIRDLVAAGNILFFTADDGVHGRQLWRSDGTVAGTYPVTTLQDEYNEGPTKPVAFGTTVMFTANTATGHELWRSDGTVNGTRLVKDINPGDGDSFPQDVVAFDDIAFFTAYDDENGRQLWRTDGTVSGTKRITAANGEHGGLSPSLLTRIDRTLFFTTVVDRSTVALWRSDGTAAGTTQLRTMPTSEQGGTFGPLMTAGQRLFLPIVPSDTGELVLWTSDGSSTGTHELKRFPREPESAFPTAWGAVDKWLIFQGTDDLYATEPWASDGTPEGTTMLANIADDGVRQAFLPLAKR